MAFDSSKGFVGYAFIFVRMHVLHKSQILFGEALVIKKLQARMSSENFLAYSWLETYPDKKRII